MRLFYYALFLALGIVGLNACEQPSVDVIEVQLEAGEGMSPFAHGMTISSEYDTTANTVWSKSLQTVSGIPDSLGDYTLYSENLQVRQLVYYGYKAGLMDSAYYKTWTSSTDFNETDYTTAFVDQQVQYIVSRDLDSNYVLIFDTNNNEDFSDEQALTLPREAPSDHWLEQEAFLPAVPVEYELYDGQNIITAEARLTMNPYMKLVFQNKRRLWIGDYAYKTGELEHDGQKYAWWSASPMSAGVYLPKQTRVWFEKMPEANFPERPAKQVSLLEEAKADTSADVLTPPEGYYPKLSEPFQIGDLVSLGEDVFELSEISPAGDRLTLYRALPSEAGLRTGLTAPDFEGPTLDSTTVRLSDYRGKYVLIDFWGTWCGPCIGEVPHLRAAYEAYPREHFDILAVANDDPEALRAYVEKEELHWTQIVQQESDSTLREVLDTYRITGYPTTFLVDPAGIIVAREGRLRGSNLLKTLAVHLDKPAMEE